MGAVTVKHQGLWAMVLVFFGYNVWPEASLFDHENETDFNSIQFYLQYNGIYNKIVSRHFTDRRSTREQQGQGKTPLW